MIGLLQRVSSASVMIEGKTIAAIGQGLLVLVAIQPDDGELQAARLLQRLLSYRVFADSEGKMNLALQDIEGGLLLVPQFTLAADTNKGNRPSFTRVAEPGHALALFTFIVKRAHRMHKMVASGQFGADMEVQLINNGPVTFWLQVM